MGDEGHLIRHGFAAPPVSLRVGRSADLTGHRPALHPSPHRRTGGAPLPPAARIHRHASKAAKQVPVSCAAEKKAKGPAPPVLFSSPARSRRRGFFAPRRERFFCLRRPHFFQQRKKWGKERRQKLRFCTSSARYARQRFPASSRGHNLSSPLSVKRTACTLTGAEADAAACPRHGRNFPLLPPQPAQGLFRAAA